MQIELHCSNCSRRFVAPPEAAAEDIVARMCEQSARYTLGEGETFEDMIFSALSEQGAICCPDCGDAVQVSEESLGRMALEVLAQW